LSSTTNCAFFASANQRTLITTSARLLSIFCASGAAGSWIVLSTFSTWAEVIIMKNTRMVRRTSTMGAT
jgi:hypothetical protein